MRRMLVNRRNTYEYLHRNGTLSIVLIYNLSQYDSRCLLFSSRYVISLYCSRTSGSVLMFVFYRCVCIYVCKNTISSKDPPLTAGVPQNTTPIKIYIIRKLLTYSVKAETLITFNNKFGAQSEREKS